MNLQERELLSLFLQQLTSAQASARDPEAESLIAEACTRQPNASYLLVQRAMQLEHVLKLTQAQASQLRAELQQVRAGTQTSFLDDANSWGRNSTPASQAPVSAGQAPVMAPRPTPNAVALPVSPAAAPSAWGSGLLGTVATTAAGVVAGSFLYQGIENLMGRHHQGGAWGSNAGNAMDPLAGNTTINNYYSGEKPEEETDANDASTVDYGDAADAGGSLGGSDDSV